MPPKRTEKPFKVNDDDEDYVNDRKYIDDDEDDEYMISPADKGKARGRKKGTVNRKTSASSSSSVNRITNSDFNDGVIGFQDYSDTLSLKPDHEKRPIWVTEDNLIILEAFSPYYTQAYDFLIDIAEPEARPEFIQSYRLTEDSLYAAVAVSWSTESIIKVLNILCKTQIPNKLIKYIRDCTYTFGKAKLVLKDNNFYVESQYSDVLRELLKHPSIKAARVFDDRSKDGFLESSVLQEDRRNTTKVEIDVDDDENDDELVGNSDGRDSLKTVSFMVAQNSVQEVKRYAKEHCKYPLLEEYDFRNDNKNPLLSMDLRPSTTIRPYQERSLSKMFGNGRARSGIIVLPCGAGKSLTGVTAASTIKRATIVMCINNSSVNQWKDQFLTWTTLPEKSIKKFTSGFKDTLPSIDEACIVITTYAMVCHGGRRSEAGAVMMKAVSGREWGLMILDEVHVAPADMFQKVLNIVNAHCKLGLTATLVREDNKIKDLSFLVGPKLYEANWIDLTRQGYLANVQCVEVWCPMTKEFFGEYIKLGLGANSRTQRLLYTLNPRKFRACEYLVKYHSKRGDKIIIFSDDVPALILYCTALKDDTCGLAVPYIFGETKEDDRRRLLMMFRTKSEMSCIGLSQVGDTALDLPEANVIIQVSSHFGARRQEAQRLGRILRPKPNPTGGFNAFFYTLVSTDTREMYFSSKRQQYLVDQGYTFKVQQDLVDIADRESTLLCTKEQEMTLLNQVVSFTCETYDQAENKALEKTGRGEVDDEGEVQQGTTRKRTATTLGAISGADGTIYTEFDKR